MILGPLPVKLAISYKLILPSKNERFAQFCSPTLVRTLQITNPLVLESEILKYAFAISHISIQSCLLIDSVLKRQTTPTNEMIFCLLVQSQLVRINEIRARLHPDEFIRIHQDVISPINLTEQAPWMKLYIVFQWFTSFP